MAIHVQVISRLAPDDLMLIEEEHARLHGSISNLRSTCSHLASPRSCQSCGREKLATCRGRLVSSSYNILDFSANHFVNEEAIMLKRAHETDEYDAYHSHQQAHRQMLNKLAGIARESTLLDEDGRTAEAYQRLYMGMTDIFQKHERLFDRPFMRAIDSPDISSHADAINQY